MLCWKLSSRWVSQIPKQPMTWVSEVLKEEIIRKQPMKYMHSIGQTWRMQTVPMAYLSWMTVSTVGINRMIIQSGWLCFIRRKPKAVMLIRIVRTSVIIHLLIVCCLIRENSGKHKQVSVPISWTNRSWHLPPTNMLVVWVNLSLLSIRITQVLLSRH